MQDALLSTPKTVVTPAKKSGASSEGLPTPAKYSVLRALNGRAALKACWCRSQLLEVVSHTAHPIRKGSISFSLAVRICDRLDDGEFTSDTPRSTCRMALLSIMQTSCSVSPLMNSSDQRSPVHSLPKNTPPTEKNCVPFVLSSQNTPTRQRSMFVACSRNGIGMLSYPVYDVSR